LCGFRWNIKTNQLRASLITGEGDREKDIENEEKSFSSERARDG